jgi:ParB family chromosome partitioning protein
MAKKIALGKGIASLIQETPNELLKANLTEKENNKEVETNPSSVPIGSIEPNPNQPRKIFKEKELQELSLSIKENGILQPLIVTKTKDGFELIAGERRLRASKLAGLTHVPVIIKRATDKDKMVLAVIENIQRSDLNCVEEAIAYFQLMNEYHLTQEQLAKQLGKERSTVANFLRILKLPRTVVDMLQKELLSFGHGKVLSGEKDKDLALKFAETAVKENLSVRELEDLMKKGFKEEKVKQKSKKSQNDDMEQFADNLMKQTGYHFAIKSKKNGSGQIVIHYNNEEEFNGVYNFLMQSK